MPAEFTEEEYQKVINYWNAESRKKSPPDLVSIVSFFSDGVEKDPRSKIGHKVRGILSAAKLKAKTQLREKAEEVILTSEQKEFAKNNVKDNRIFDLAKTLFPNIKIQPLGGEVRAIKKYLEEIGEYVVKKEEGTLPEGKYVPPYTFHSILAKVNTYLHMGLSTQSITAYQRKCLETTGQFLHSPRFLQEINNYATVEKRIAFESEFIRSVYEKPDMSVDEVNLTINLCNDYIQASDIKKQLEKLNGILDTITDDPDGRISMGITEAIGKVTSSYNECVKRHQTLYSLLNTSRSKRILEKNAGTANIVNIIEFFREEDGRARFLKQAELLKHKRKEEVDKIEKLDDVLLLALGISMEEATS